MRIQPQVLAVGIRVDIIVSDAFKFGIDGRGEAIGTPHGASSHGLDATESVRCCHIQEQKC